MRTTVTIDDDLLRELKERAHTEGTSLAKLINRVLRRGIRESSAGGTRPRAYRQTTYPMGEPKLSLDKALALAASLEDEEVCEKWARRK